MLLSPAIWPAVFPSFFGTAIRMLRYLIVLFLYLLSTLVSAQQADVAAEKRDYVLGAGDVIRVSVFQNPDLTLDTRVGESGDITYPLLGSIKVGGLSIAEAEKRIASLLREGQFVLQPQVNILLTMIRGNQIAVLGQVNRPGRYPLETANMKLTDVLALAGGTTPSGADTIILIGQKDGKVDRREIDVPSMFLNNALEQDVAIRNGDILYVHRAPMFYIYGEVNRPGSYRIEREMTLMQALATGGGISMRGSERGMRIHRRGSDGKIQRIRPEMDELIRADDVIYVRESLF